MWQTRTLPRSLSARKIAAEMTAVETTGIVAVAPTGIGAEALTAIGAEALTAIGAEALTRDRRRSPDRSSRYDRYPSSSRYSSRYDRNPSSSRYRDDDRYDDRRWYSDDDRDRRRHRSRSRSEERDGRESRPASGSAVVDLTAQGAHWGFPLLQPCSRCAVGRRQLVFPWMHFLEHFAKPPPCRAPQLRQPSSCCLRPHSPRIRCNSCFCSSSNRLPLSLLPPPLPWERPLTLPLRWPESKPSLQLSP